MMKKINKIFTVLLGVLAVSWLCGCSFMNMVEETFYIYVENDTDDSITVDVEEDPRTLVSQKMGVQKETVKLKSGETKGTKVVGNDYFRILVNGKVVEPKEGAFYSSSMNTDKDGNTWYYMGENCTVVVKVEAESMYWYTIRRDPLEWMD